MKSSFRTLISIAFLTSLSVGCGDNIQKKTGSNNVNTNNFNSANNVNNSTNNVNNLNNVNSLNNVNNSTNNVNNLNNVNNGEAEFRFTLVRDITEDIEFCEGGDPGSDLIQVALLTGEGNIKGWANLYDDGILTDGNLFDTGVNIDGTTPAGINVCPDFNSENITSLGCGGYIVVEFLDSTGQPVPAVEGDQIEVYEFGAPYCDAGTTADRYNVFACTDEFNVPGSCSVPIIENGTARSVGLVASER